MARQPRMEYPGAVYHVVARGNGGKRIFLDDKDHERFLDTLEEGCGKTGWRVHAYALMGNHYHLLLETPEANLVVGMGWLQQTFTQRWNVRHKHRGHLFQGRYKAVPVESDNEGYFGKVADYIHLNPARAGLIDFDKGGRVEQFEWCSAWLLAQPKRQWPDWFVAECFLGEHGFSEHARGRLGYLNYLNKRARAEEIEKAARDGRPSAAGTEAELWKEIREGWFIGSESFREELLARVDKVVSSHGRERYHGGARRAHDLLEAQRLLSAGMRLLKVGRADLAEMKKGAVEKQLLAFLLRTRTTVSNAWITGELSMGHTTNVSNGVRAIRESKSQRVAKLRAALDML